MWHFFLYSEVKDQFLSLRDFYEKRINFKMNQLNEEIESHLSLQKTAMTKIFNIEIKYMKESNEDLRVQLHFKEK